jgi:hypothetical protein
MHAADDEAYGPQYGESAHLVDEDVRLETPYAS